MITNETIGLSYQVDVESSTLAWTGKKLIGSGHTGNIKLQSGTINFEENELVAGHFIIDTTTITNTDLTDKGYNDNLVGHLKSDDFFGVEKHPEAKFVITQASKTGEEEYNITGDLTIKDITHPVTFTATIKQNNDKIEANSKILVDRTKYDIKYNSDNFFSGLGDKVIKNEFVLDLYLVAQK